MHSLIPCIIWFSNLIQKFHIWTTTWGDTLCIITINLKSDYITFLLFWTKTCVISRIWLILGSGITQWLFLWWDSILARTPSTMHWVWIHVLCGLLLWLCQSVYRVQCDSLHVSVTTVTNHAGIIRVVHYIKTLKPPGHKGTWMIQSPLDHKGTLVAQSFTLGSLHIKFRCSYLHSSYTWDEMNVVLKTFCR